MDPHACIFNDMDLQLDSHGSSMDLHGSPWIPMDLHGPFHQVSSKTRRFTTFCCLVETRDTQSYIPDINSTTAVCTVRRFVCLHLYLQVPRGDFVFPSLPRERVGILERGRAFGGMHAKHQYSKQTTWIRWFGDVVSSTFCIDSHMPPSHVSWFTPEYVFFRRLVGDRYRP